MKVEYFAVALLIIAIVLMGSEIREVVERFDPGFGESLIHIEQTKHQEIEIVDLPIYGNALLLDGEFQLSEGDEGFYHEALVHPALFMHRDPKKVLIIGGGDGGALKESLKHDVDVTMVELDERVIEVSKEYFSFSEDAFNDERANVVIGEGRSFLKTTNETYDIIMMDLSDPDNEKVAMLYTKEFYGLAKARLSDEGIVVTQAESPVYYPYAYASIVKTMDSVFNTTHAYSEFVPIFGEWGYSLSCNYECDPIASDVIGRINNTEIETIHYDSDAHRDYFLLDKKTKEILESDVSINEDETLRLVQYNLVVRLHGFQQ